MVCVIVFYWGHPLDQLLLFAKGSKSYKRFRVKALIRDRASKPPSKRPLCFYVNGKLGNNTPVMVDRAILRDRDVYRLTSIAQALVSVWRYMDQGSSGN